MGQKKDIGKLFENRLVDTKNNLSKNLWEKINNSLDTEKRRKKRILFYWITGLGLTVLFGLFLVFSSGLFLNPNTRTPENSTLLTDQPFSPSEKENDQKPNENILKDSLRDIKLNSEKLSEVITNQDDSTVAEINNSKKMKIEKRSSKDKSVDETFTVSKKYYYYNSQDGKQLITTNKKEIDSLVSDRHKPLDSLVTKKADSLGQ